MNGQFIGIFPKEELLFKGTHLSVLHGMILLLLQFLRQWCWIPPRDPAEVMNGQFIGIFPKEELLFKGTHLSVLHGMNLILGQAHSSDLALEFL